MNNVSDDLNIKNKDIERIRLTLRNDGKKYWPVFFQGNDEDLGLNVDTALVYTMFVDLFYSYFDDWLKESDFNYDTEKLADHIVNTNNTFKVSSVIFGASLGLLLETEAEKCGKKIDKGLVRLYIKNSDLEPKYVDGLLYGFTLITDYYEDEFGFKSSEDGAGLVWEAGALACAFLGETLKKENFANPLLALIMLRTLMAPFCDWVTTNSQKYDYGSSKFLYE